MSVSRQQQFVLPFRAISDATAAKNGEIKPGPALDAGGVENGAFWKELDRTLDEFFNTIDLSKQHIQQLNESIAERDRMIELLEKENAELRSRAAAPTGRDDDSGEDPDDEPIAMSTAEPNTPAPVAELPRPPAPSRATASPRGIWWRLTHLERDNGDSEDD